MSSLNTATPARGMTFDEALATIPFSRSFDINGTQRVYRYTEADRISAAREVLAREADAIARSNMTPDQQELLDLRKSLRITQVQMAEAIGMPARTYQMLENGETITKPWHLKAAQLAAMELVIHQPKSEMVSLLPANLRELAGSVALYERDMAEREAKAKKRAVKRSD